MDKKKIRCAIYTRKSSEEGLEQDFNSLDAQREACEAYIKSQMHEGWVLVEKEYSDGGYSGGTMERPAFKELMKDIEDDLIDIVVVYKVDRLTRSLMDFSKIIDIFDKHSASFVSITQQFNTTTSMGRLTLNILLSFAQFEREVTGERIRDKFEASRKKGLWMTGAGPYGYENGEHHILKVKQPYADNVKIIFELYTQEKTVAKLREKLIEIGIKSERGKNFSRGILYRILSNKVYIGKIVHNNRAYDGQHEPIISEELFYNVQNILKANAVVRKNQLNAKNGSLLMGLLYDDVGNKMSPTSSGGKNKRYRYYFSQSIKKKGEYLQGEITKISAGEIENYVKNDFDSFFKNTKLIQSYFAEETITNQDLVIKGLETFEPDKVFLRTAVKRVDLKPDFIEVTYDIGYIKNYFLTIFCNIPFIESEGDHLIVNKKIVKISQIPQRKNKIIILGQKNYDMTLIKALIKSFWYNKLGAERKLPIKARNGNNKRLRKLRFLPPNIIESIMNGEQDPDWNVKKLIEIANEYVK